MQIIKYYDDEDLPNLSTYHLWGPITVYDGWNVACTTTFRQLNIPLTYTDTWIAHVRPVTVPEIKRCIRLTLAEAKHLSELVIYTYFDYRSQNKHWTPLLFFCSFFLILKISLQDRAAVNDMNIFLKAVRTSLSGLQLELDRLQPPDAPYARGPFTMAENPLKRMIRMHYIEYYNALFMWFNSYTHAHTVEYKSKWLTHCIFCYCCSHHYALNWSLHPIRNTSK